MSTLICNLPSTKVWVRKEYLRDFKDDHVYPQAPYQDIDKKQYEEFCKKMPKSIDWAKLKEYEKEDTTIGSKEFACTADSCEVVDIT